MSTDGLAWVILHFGPTLLCAAVVNFVRAGRAAFLSSDHGYKRLTIAWLAKWQLFVFALGVFSISVFVRFHRQPGMQTRPRLNIIPRPLLKAAARYEDNLMLDAIGGNLMPWHDPSVKRTQEVVRSLTASRQYKQSARHQRNSNVTIHVINCPEVNAMTSATGALFIFRGLTDSSPTTARLGSVVAHEIAHSMLGHPEENVSLTKLMQMVLIPMHASIWLVFPSDLAALLMSTTLELFASFLVLLPIRRRQELEADRLGLLLSAAACHDPREYEVFWGALSLMMYDRNSTVQRLAERWSSHPTQPQRYYNVQQFLAKALDNPKFYDESLCGVFPEPDPRQAPLKVEARRIVDLINVANKLPNYNEENSFLAWLLGLRRRKLCPDPTPQRRRSESSAVVKDSPVERRNPSMSPNTSHPPPPRGEPSSSPERRIDL